MDYAILDLVHDAIRTLGSFAMMAAMWAAIATFLSITSGWRRLSRTFRLRADSPPPVPTTACTGTVGWAQYKHSLKLGADEEALYIGVFFLLRFSHPWLRIPWSQVRDNGQTGLVIHRKQLTLDPGGQAVRLRVPLHTWKDLAVPQLPDQYSG